jgi:hypothetical protein
LARIYGGFAARAREKRVMFNKGAAIDQGRFCVLTILYTRVYLRISTFNFSMCLGVQILFSSYKNSEPRSRNKNVPEESKTPFPLDGYYSVTQNLCAFP